MEFSANIADYMDVIEKVPLFEDIAPDGLRSLLICLAPALRILGPGEIVQSAGDVTRKIGVVLRGCVHGVKIGPDGSQKLVAKKSAGEIYGEVLVCTEGVPSPVTVFSEDKSAVMLIDYSRLLGICPSTCDHHSLLIRNILRVISRQYFDLHEQIGFLARKSLRSKLCAYLYLWSGQGKNSQFIIPLNRSELAEYIGVERSAMSRELGRMRDEGIIDFYKSSFKVLDFTRFEG